MEFGTRVILLILILISSKVWNGFCISQEEDQISKRQTGLLTAGSAAPTKAIQSTKQPQCLQNEHGPNCTYCVAHDTCEEGHFTCDVNTGNKICLQGYQGNNCRISTKLANNFYDVTCPENTCRNGGSCASGHCCCREGFTGILCEIEIIECKSNSCLNGGICKDLIGKFECLCKPTFRGKNCEIPVSANVQTTPSRDSSCQSKSCQNNGTCLDDTFLTYCLCPTFYTGDSCETHIGTSSTVHNTCPEYYFGKGCQTFCQPQDDCSGHYVCDQSTGGKICMSGWHGQNCDTRTIPQRIDPECPQHSCKNDGQCFTNGCCCRNNYTGDNCQIESIGCLSSPCKNNATCSNKGNGFSCECPPNFTGKMCENDIKPSTVEPKATDTQYTHSTFHTFTYSTATLNNQHVSSHLTAYISSKYPVQSSFAVSSTLSDVTHAFSQSRIVSPSTEILSSTQIPLIYTGISNHVTGKSESHFTGTESPISSRLSVWEISSSSLYSGVVTPSFPLSSYLISHKEPHMKSSSSYTGIFSSQDVLPMSSAGITSKLSENVGARTSASDFVSVSNSFEKSSLRNIPKFSTTTSHNIPITPSFDSSHSVQYGAISGAVDISSPAKSSSVFVGIHISKFHISPTVVNPSFSDHTDSNILSLSSSNSVSLLQQAATTTAAISTNAFENSVLYTTSSNPSPIPSKSSVFAVGSTSISPSFSSNTDSKYLHASTPRISLSSFETTLSIQQNSLSHTLPIIAVSSIQNFTSRVYNTTMFTKTFVQPDHSSIFTTSTSQNMQITAFQGTSMQTSDKMSMFINTFIHDPSELLSSTESTTKLNIVPTQTVTASNGFGQTTVSNIKPSATLIPSFSSTESMYSVTGFSSVTDTAIPSLSGVFMTISTTIKLVTPYSDSLKNQIPYATDIHTTSGINYNSAVQPETRVVDFSSYISPTATSSPSISSGNITFYISPSTSIQTNIASSSSNSIVSTSSKAASITPTITRSISNSRTASSITPSITRSISNSRAASSITPTITRSISNSRAASSITPTITRSISNYSRSGDITTTNIAKTVASSSTTNTVIDKTTARSITANRSRAPTKTSSFNEKSTFAFVPTSSRKLENIMQSTHVEQVSPTLIVTHLNTDSNEGISKSWRIALIVIGVALFVLAIVFLAVFISVRQRRKDSRIIRQLPEDIQDYSKEHFSGQPDFHNPTYEVENDSDDDSVKYDMYIVNE